MLLSCYVSCPSTSKGLYFLFKPRHYWLMFCEAKCTIHSQYISLIPCITLIYQGFCPKLYFTGPWIIAPPMGTMINEDLLFRDTLVVEGFKTLYHPPLRYGRGKRKNNWTTNSRERYSQPTYINCISNSGSVFCSCCACFLTLWQRHCDDTKCLSLDTAPHA